MLGGEKGLNNTGKALILLSLVAVAAIISSVALTAYATDDDTENAVEVFGWRNRWGRGLGRGCGRFGFVEVSEEFENKAITIAESDEDVQGLLADGYNVTGVRPIIKTMVDANGDVTMKATSAIVMLENEDSTGHASVWVDMEGETVTRIVILTRTVIDKTSQAPS